MKRHLAILLCFALLAVLLGGCGGPGAVPAALQCDAGEMQLLKGETRYCGYTLTARAGELSYTVQYAGTAPEYTALQEAKPAHAQRVFEAMDGWPRAWSSDDPAVVTVADDGLLTAVAPGKTTVRLEVTGDEVVRAALVVTVIPPLAGLKTAAELELEVGRTHTLEVAPRPQNARLPVLSYESSAPETAAVSEEGVVTALANGTAVISVFGTAEQTGETLTAKVTVRVVTQPSAIQLSHSEATLRQGDGLQLTATPLPDTVNVPVQLLWSSSNEAVAAVDAQGAVRAVAPGTATVTVAIEGDSDIAAACSITVTAPPPPPAAPAGGGTAVDLLALVNGARAAEGLAALAWNEELAVAAALRAAELEQLFDHTRPDGSAWHTVSGLARGENIAYGYGSAQAVFEGWMNSPGHRANILNPDFTLLGCGYSSSGGNYWCQLFG